MNDDRSKEWKHRFDNVWERGNYRQGSTAQRMVPFLLEHIKPGQSVNDYGCGTGRADVDLYKAGITDINLIDISANALESEVKALPLTFYHASLWSLPDRLPWADWGLCINVLMTIPPDKIDDTLAGIFKTCDNLIVEVYGWSDVRLGEEMTTTRAGMEWWMDKLREYWPTVAYHRSPETDQRYIYLCRR